jgi:hypothetical protein
MDMLQKYDGPKLRVEQRLERIFPGKVRENLTRLRREYPSSNKLARALNKMHPESPELWVDSASLLNYLKKIGLELGHARIKRQMWYPTRQEIIDAAREVGANLDRLETRLKIHQCRIREALERRYITTYFGGLYETNSREDRLMFFRMKF